MHAMLNEMYGTTRATSSRHAPDEKASEHREGRALDYELNVDKAEDRAVATDIINWMQKADQLVDQKAAAPI